MSFYVCFMLAVAVLLLMGAALLWRKKTHKGLKSLYLIFIGVALAAVAILFPVYLSTLDESVGALKALALSIHNMIRLFVVDDDFSLVREQIATLGGVFGKCYWFLSVALYLAAPILTFGVVLSFFRNLISERRYLFRYFSPAYAFSELNEKSLALATDLKKQQPKAVLVFAGAFEEDEDRQELYDKAERLGAICFPKSLVDIGLQMHSKKAPITFFVMAENDDAQNIDQALTLIDRYRERDLVRMYVFSSSTSGEVLFENIDCGKIRLQRIEEGQKLVSALLYTRGSVIFDHAVPDPVSGEKVITALVIGLGRNGTEMLSSLVWFGQMTGYRLVLHAFDADPDAEAHFASLCPELMDKRYNGKQGTDQDACYSITVHSGMDVTSSAFTKALAEISGISYVFVSLGNDETNLTVARNIRMLTTRKGDDPAIQAVVLRPVFDLYRYWKKKDPKEEKEAQEQKCDWAGQYLRNLKGQPYGIEFVGSRSELYSARVMLNSDLERAALSRHLKWGQEDDFWRIEYNYRSSIASALHRIYKVYCGVPGADVAPEERAPQDKEALRRLEHRRWNAYMRSVGYVHASVRNEIAKTHHCLVPFDELPPEEQAKDDD